MRESEKVPLCAKLKARVPNPGLRRDEVETLTEALNILKKAVIRNIL
jgi:hypothetical protein